MEKNIKLVAIDLDGTLLNSDKKVSRKNFEIIKKLRAKGIFVVIATGRPLGGFSWILDDLELNSDDDYSITNTGSLIIKNKDRSDVSKKILSMGDYLNLKKIINDKLQIGIYNKYNLYSNSEKVNKHFLFESEILKMPIEKIYEKDMSQRVDRITITGNKDAVDEFEKNYNEKLLKTYQTVRNVPEVFEVLHKEADKGQALKRLCEILNVDLESTLAIGDSNNDKTMLNMAGVSATCGNGRESVKEMVDIVSNYSNDEDGVCDILEKVFFAN
ncbi:Cof-type HAD-IIB family hydrolase [Anaerococcus vaginalis]|uniref:Cof-type HAD-IIB family hydrolase n=1 Tax=Anaerococcus vaginalis TaxID=33037 RepID=UPI002904F03D|nr:Cof-type HAD-IIB family hydrolase [Anaerococcus vaginalis]MDU2649330.1 Cof-type HAD-IIB family hydrolase [Anaerococcus vaginalis]